MRRRRRTRRHFLNSTASVTSNLATISVAAAAGAIITLSNPAVSATLIAPNHIIAKTPWICSATLRRGLARRALVSLVAGNKTPRSIPVRTMATKNFQIQKDSIKPHLTSSDRVQTTLDPCVILMKSLISRHSSLWEDKGGICSLAQGVVHWAPPPTAFDAITSSISDPNNELHKYCPDEGLPELITALKQKLAKENGLEKVEVIVTAGANQAYVNCVLTLLSEEEKCVVFKPYYFNHVMAVQMSRGERSLVVGNCDADGFPDIQWLAKELNNKGNMIKMVTLVNPGNPTGVSLPTSTIQAMVDLCEKFGVWLVLDNTYEHFDHPNVNTSEKGFHCWSNQHVINIFSFSKGYAMAGFRCGYVVMSSNEIGGEMYQQMLKVQDTIPICATRISQVAAIGALESGRKWVLDQVQSLDTGRNAILNAMSPMTSIMGGTGAMYVMGRLPDGMDDQEAADILVERFGVAVIPGSFCGFPGWVRVCYSNLPPAECKVAAERLAKGIRFLCADSPTT